MELATNEDAASQSEREREREMESIFGMLRSLFVEGEPRTGLPNAVETASKFHALWSGFVQCL